MTQPLLSIGQVTVGQIFVRLPMPRLATEQVLAAALMLCLPAVSAHAQFDQFADDVSPKNFSLSAQGLELVLKGELELELHDLEGQGGPGFDSVTDTRTLGTRSPFAEIDGLLLAPRLSFSGLGLGTLAVNTVIAINARGAAVTAAWFDFRHVWPTLIEHHFEVGFNTPFVKVDRITERYPLIATAYWREPEAHATYEASLSLGHEVVFTAGASAALMRPLTLSSIQEGQSHRGTINIVSYAAARPLSGNAPVWGAKAEAQAFGLSATAFAFVGTLAAEGGTDELRNNFGAFSALDGDPTDATFYWSGLRLGFKRAGLDLLAEAIISQESTLRRWGGYAQAAYTWRRPHVENDFLVAFIPLLRIETYRLPDAIVPDANGRTFRNQAPSQAATWGFDIFTAALTVLIYREVVRLRAEFAFVREDNGVPALGLSDVPLRNDELLLQLEVRF